MPMPETSVVATVDWPRVMALRLERHSLAARTSPDRLVDLVRDIVGVHAQVASAAELQLAARVDGLRVEDVRDALWERRSLVKAWSMRGTLHLLASDDLATYVAAAATRERWREPVWQRAFSLDEATAEAITAAVGDILGDRPMTRADLADAVARQLDDADLATRLRSGWGTYLGMPAQRGVLISGPSDGRNVTFVRPSAWLGRPVAALDRAPAVDPMEALAALVRRFLGAFPGSSRDMTARWWGARRGTFMARVRALLGDDVVDVSVTGLRAWTLAEDVPALVSAQPFSGVRLLPAFDPFTNELPRRTDELLPVARHADVYRVAGWVTPLVLVDGRIAGTWQIDAGVRDVPIRPWEPWRDGARREAEAEVDRFAAFLGRPLHVVWEGPSKSEASPR